MSPRRSRKLLAGCDRRTAGRPARLAILLLLARFGLRAGEVAAIELEDVDWRAGELLVRGKGNRHDGLPLPVDVGEALVSLSAPPTAERRVSGAVLARAGAARRRSTRGTVGVRSSRRCAAGGIAAGGPHRLRHTAATEMLGAARSLAEIAQVLRHRQLKTTAHYAKVDRNALRLLALPWPGGRS